MLECCLKVFWNIGLILECWKSYARVLRNTFSYYSSVLIQTWSDVIWNVTILECYNHNTRVLSLFFLHSSVRMKVLCFWRIETRYSSVEKSILECWSTLSLNTRVLCLKCCLSFENFCPILECWKLSLECWQHFLHNSSVCNQVQVF